MSYRLSCSDFSAPSRLGQSGWWRSQLPTELGRCLTDHIVLDPGLSLVYAQYQANRDLLHASRVERPRSLTITVALEGESSTLGVDGGRFDFVQGSSTIAAFANVRGQRRFPAHRPVRQLRLVAEAALLQRYGLAHLLDGIRHEDIAQRLHVGPHSAVIRHLADTVTRLHAQGGGLLDLQIAALGLLAEQTRCLLPATAITPLRASDQDKILRARDLMAAHYAQALTLGYLCAAVGTNECKLKQGFRDLFGTTPHRLLTRIRMERAWELLHSGQRVSSVAYQVGYRHPSSFSAAFEKHYGRAPRTVNRA